MHSDVATLRSGIELAYDVFGDPADRPLLLVMGLGGPGLWWDWRLCEQLADRGFFVIRFDNRDVGRSSRIDAVVTRRQVVRAYLGQPVQPPYGLGDLAADAFGLLDHLGIRRAHVTGVSMGGMIAQTMAITEPDRVRSLVSMLSTTGRRRVGWTNPRLFPLLLGRRKTSLEAYVAGSQRAIRALCPPQYRPGPEETDRKSAATWERGVDQPGAVRQTLAILCQPDRTQALGRLRLPALALHGTSDRLVHSSGGRATAAAIPGCELVMVPGLGHDLPVPLHGLFADVITRTAEREHAAEGARRSTPATSSAW